MSDFDKYITTVPMVALLTVISSDPTPPEKWTKLYNNLLFRFIFMYILLYQSTNDHNTSLNYTIGVIMFFYMMSTPEEKKNNFNLNFNNVKNN